MAHKINGIKMTIAKWTKNEKGEIDTHSRLLSEEIFGEFAEEVMLKFRNMCYNNDLMKVSPLEIICVEEF